MWKCNKCGCAKFIENYRNGYRQFEEYDKDGEPVYETLTDDDRGYHLKDIAYWEED